MNYEVVKRYNYNLCNLQQVEILKKDIGTRSEADDWVKTFKKDHPSKNVIIEVRENHLEDNIRMNVRDHRGVQVIARRWL
jgi:hypothetical protein